MGHFFIISSSSHFFNKTDFEQYLFNAQNVTKIEMITIKEMIFAYCMIEKAAYYLTLLHYHAQTFDFLFNHSRVVTKYFAHFFQIKLSQTLLCLFVSGKPRFHLASKTFNITFQRASCCKSYCRPLYILEHQFQCPLVE